MIIAKANATHPAQARATGARQGVSRPLGDAASRRDPFAVPMAEKLDLLRRVSEEVKKSDEGVLQRRHPESPRRGQVFRVHRGLVDPAADLADLRQRRFHRRGPREQHLAHPQLHAHAGLGRLGIRARDEPGGERAAHSRGSRGAPVRAGGEARQEGPAADAEPPDADDSRERRASHRARPRARATRRTTRAPATSRRTRSASASRASTARSSATARRRARSAPWATTTRA